MLIEVSRAIMALIYEKKLQRCKFDTVRACRVWPHSPTWSAIPSNSSSTRCESFERFYHWLRTLTTISPADVIAKSSHWIWTNFRHDFGGFLFLQTLKRDPQVSELFITITRTQHEQI